jgi:hypothetical protein
MDIVCEQMADTCVICVRAGSTISRELWKYVSFHTYSETFLIVICFGWDGMDCSFCNVNNTNRCATCEATPVYCRFHLEQSHIYHPITREHSFSSLTSGAAPIETKSFIDAISSSIVNVNVPIQTSSTSTSTPTSAAKIVANSDTTTETKKAANVAIPPATATAVNGKKESGKKQGGGGGGKKETPTKAVAPAATTVTATTTTAAAAVGGKEEKKKKSHPAWHGPHLPEALPSSIAASIPRVLNSLTSKLEPFIPASSANGNSNSSMLYPSHIYLSIMLLHITISFD